MVVVAPAGCSSPRTRTATPNEAQLLEWHPRAPMPRAPPYAAPGIEILPGVQDERGAPLPSLLDVGAEMGANEHGLAIATRQSSPTSPTRLPGSPAWTCSAWPWNGQPPRPKPSRWSPAAGAPRPGRGAAAREARLHYHNSSCRRPHRGLRAGDGRRLWEWSESPLGPQHPPMGSPSPPLPRSTPYFLKTRVSACRNVGRSPRPEPKSGGRSRGPHGRSATFTAAPPPATGSQRRMAAPACTPGLAAGSQPPPPGLAELAPRRPTHWGDRHRRALPGLFKPVSVHDPLDLGPPPHPTASTRCPLVACRVFPPPGDARPEATSLLRTGAGPDRGALAGLAARPRTLSARPTRPWPAGRSP